jgi:Zn-finger nucleic acid-binding protein
VLVDQCTGCGGLFLDRGELGTRHPPLRRRPLRHHRTPRSPARRTEVTTGSTSRATTSATTAGTTAGYQQKPYQKKKSFLSELFDD